MQRAALFELLTDSPEAIFVVTSNRRLARALAAEFDRYHIADGRAVWSTPHILPFSAFVATLYDAAQHDPDLAGVPAPLTTAQERGLWEAVVSDSNLGMLSPTVGAALAAEAWALAHQWNVASSVRRYTAVADTRVFVKWADEYLRRAEAALATDQARLPDIVREYVEAGTIATPGRVLLAGFDETTPQQQRLFDALVRRGTACDRFEPVQHHGIPLRAACLDAQDEHEKVADWAAARIAANPRARIGVVVPQLDSRRRSLTAALDAALVPDRPLAPASARPYTISLGGPLCEVALVAFFLRSIRLTLVRVPFEEASAMLRSPYFAGAANERDARDLMDAQLRQRCQRSVDLERIFEAAQTSARDCGADVGRLLAGLRTLAEWRRQHATRSHRPSEWASAFAQALQSVSEAEGGSPPVQVLGLLEANALTFDHLWIMGLTSEAWPVASQPNPLLPVELQHAAGMPGASAAAELERSRRQLQRLMQSAPEVIVSHATVDVDRRVAPSPMISSFEEWNPLPRTPRLIDVIAPSSLTTTRDALAPAWRATTPLRGGAAILQNQA